LRLKLIAIDDTKSARELSAPKSDTAGLTIAYY